MVGIPKEQLSQLPVDNPIPNPHPIVHQTYPPGTYAPGTYPPVTYAPGTYPPGPYPHVQYPPGPYPPGPYPHLQYPPGPYPPGPYPPGPYPPVQYPPEQNPPVQHPPPQPSPPINKDERIESFNCNQQIQELNVQSKMQALQNQYPTLVKSLSFNNNTSIVKVVFKMQPGWKDVKKLILAECIKSQMVEYPATITKDRIDEVYNQILQDFSSAISEKSLVIVLKQSKKGKIIVYGA